MKKLLNSIQKEWSGIGWEHPYAIRSSGISQAAACSLLGTMLDPLLSNWTLNMIIEWDGMEQIWVE